MGNAYILPDYKTYLGGGSFGHVYKGTYRGKDVAVKVINRHMLKEKYCDIDKNEIVPFLKGLKHRNVVSILAWEDKDYELWLALELCDTGLDKYVRQCEPSDEETCDILRQGAYGLSYLHNNQIIHRDIRPDNMLVVRTDSEIIIKLTDFSLCKNVDDEGGSTMTTVWGNPFWLAPELLNDDGHKAADVRYKRSIDVFSFALVIMYVCFNTEGREKINRASCGVMSKAGKDIIQHFDEYWRNAELKDMFLPILAKMLQRDPNSRPTMESVAMMIYGNPPRGMQLLTSHNLPVHQQASIYVGIGGDNSIVLSTEQKQLVFLQLQDEHYKQVWTNQCPSNMRGFQERFLLDDLIVVRPGIIGDDPTQCWDFNLRKRHSHFHGSNLALKAAFSPHTIVYRDHSPGACCLRVYDEDRRVMTLHPPSVTQWGPTVSVCKNRTTGWMAVCEYDTQCLDVYNESGSHRRHVTLGYQPGGQNALTCTDKFLIVRQNGSTVLRVHAWCGKEVAQVDLQQILASTSGKKCQIHSVGVCCGETLHVAVGNSHLKVTALHAIKII